MTNLPAISEPLHVVNFSGGAVEFIKSKDVLDFKQKLNTDRAIQFGDKIYASRLFETCEPFKSKDGLDAIIASCPQETRRRLVAEIAKYKDATGKVMPTHTAQCHLAAWSKQEKDLQSVE